jgi:hypothetical protein
MIHESSLRENLFLTGPARAALQLAEQLAAQAQLGGARRTAP